MAQNGAGSSASTASPTVSTQTPARPTGGSSQAPLPKVYAPTRRGTARPVQQVQRSNYPWKRNIVATVFWVGEKPTARNPTPNNKSSWDPQWMTNYGGYDDPNKANRAADFRPAGFIPRQNPFYIALPFNDTLAFNRTKMYVPRIVPWFKQSFKKPGKSVCKSRWVAINYGKRTCFAQWEDVGPFETDDWEYVFGNARPRNQRNKGAGIDLSPAVRDYLGIKSGAPCNWRFVEVNEIPDGPWRRYGDNNDFCGYDSNLMKAKREALRKMREARDAATRRGPLPR